MIVYDRYQKSFPILSASSAVSYSVIFRKSYRIYLDGSLEIRGVSLTRDLFFATNRTNFHERKTETW